METRILSNFVNLLSFSSTTTTKFSKFACLSFSRDPTTVKSDHLKQQQLKFVVSHRHQGSHKLSLLSTDDNNNNSLCPVTDTLINYPIASSNHELLLCSDTIGEAALWNPTTDYLKILPESSVPRAHFDHDMHYGFGFDPKSQDYKVLRFLTMWSMYEFEVELYSLKTNSWKDIAIPDNIRDMPYRRDSIHINGFFYWPVSINRGYVINRFDFSNDKFSSSHIPLPQTDKLNDDDLSDNFILVEFEGSLAVVAYSLAGVLGTDEKPFEFEIWVWNEDDDESWTRKRVCQIIVPDGHAGVGRPLGLLNNDKLYLELFMREMVVFDCGNGRLMNIGFRFDEYYPPHLFPYLESSAAAEEIKYREFISNSTTSMYKLTPIVTDSKQKQNNNELKHVINHKYEGTLCFSQLSKDDDTNNNKNVLFNFPSLGPCFYPAASCNKALLLCEVGLKGASLWNPTTDEVKKLPDAMSPSRGSHIYCYGLGFDPKLHDYKVIRFIEYYDDPAFRVELYSLKTDSCKDITSLYPHSTTPGSQTVHIHGFCYWVVQSRFCMADFIISFDFANEKFSSAPHHIPLPPPFPKEPTFRKEGPDLFLAEFHGSLAALVYTNGGVFARFGDPQKKPFELEIWVWNNDESSWARGESVIYVSDVIVEKPLGLIGNDQLYLKGSNDEVWLFDYAKGGGELKNLGLIANGRGISTYLESSFPLNGKKIIRAVPATRSSTID